MNTRIGTNIQIGANKSLKYITGIEKKQHKKWQDT